MRKLLLASLFAVAGYASAYAVQACPYPENVVQPDGSTITVSIHGDEYLSFETTIDGYTVLRNAEGYYVYAAKEGDKLVPTARVARNAANRTAADNAYLVGVTKYLKPAMSEQSARMLSDNRKSSGAHLLLHGYGKYDYSNFHGLVILVEYNDCPFTRDDTYTVWNDMINKQGFDGFMSTGLIPEKVQYTGSVRDYYYENSNGLFDPQFDVVGPVKIDYSKYYAHKAVGAQELVKAAVDSVDNIVNFADYDRDGDGIVDMVYFVFAGPGSNFSGNDSKLLWPHASTFINKRLDGVALGRYACSTELYGAESRKMLDGIGTMCHEFSHVLNLPDEYDTDYAGSGGESVDPGRWSLMASGSYLNTSRTPAGYSLYERYAIGFTTPTVISDAGTFELHSLNTSNSGYRIDSSIDDEFFLIENRQQTGWDKYLPGHGMLVWRVDSTDVDVWESNDVNVNPDHNYFELIRAKEQYSGTSVKDSDSDPFPGTAAVTALDNFTSPALRSWTGAATEVVLSNIAESEDGVISFTTALDDIPTVKEDFESMPYTDKDTANVAGKFCYWSLKKAVVDSTGVNYGKGRKAVCFVKNGELISSAIASKVTSVTLNIYNPTTSLTIFRCFYSTNGGDTWKVMKSSTGSDNVIVFAGNTEFLRYNVEVENAMFKFMEYSGTEEQHCYIDDIEFTFEKVSGVAPAMVADASGTLKARCSAGVLTVATDSDARVMVYDASGMLVGSSKATDGSATIALPSRGLYIVTQAGRSIKIAN